ncbi:unnamed protein product [Chironomus riparius]|uniref:MD-2-related lipid-recognition domain-containing protein n=1 Tax=Chironomus riparius TaxID=315576 RepID=A0A9N9S6U7_9DIPT|nr:unnamed protein product [Chironomus riparius]
MKLVSLFLVIFAIFKVNSVKPSIQYNIGVRFRSAKCSTDNNSVLLHGCYLKAYTRRIVTLNLVGSVVKPIKRPMHFQFILHYRYGTIYREVIDTKKREWCSIMDGMQTHMYIMLIIRQLKESAPKLFHKCPYQGDYQLYNITVDESKAFDMFPQGYYKLKVVVFNSTDDMVFKIDLLFEIKSPFKDSIG